MEVLASIIMVSSKLVLSTDEEARLGDWQDVATGVEVGGRVILGVG